MTKPIRYRRLEGIVEQSPDGEMTLDRDGRITFLNEAAARLFGRDRKEMIGREYGGERVPIATLQGRELPPDALPHQAVWRTGREFNGFEHVIKRHDGQNIVVSVNGRPMHARNAEIIQIILTIRDITEHKRADDQLKQSELHYRMLAESSDDYIFVIDRDNCIEYTNGSAANMLRLPAERLRGARIDQVFPQQLSDRMKANLEVVFHLGFPRSEEGAAEVGGDRFWLHTRLIPLKDRHGRVVSVMGVSRDITARKEAEDGLRVSEQQFRSILDSATVVIVELSLDHKVLEFNPEAERVYGVSRAEVIGRDYFELFLPPETWDAVAADEKKVLSGEPTRGFENTVRSRDGEERIISWFVGRLLDEKDDPRGTIAIGQDVTERQLANKALVDSEQRWRTLFDESPIAQWEADLSLVKQYFDELRAVGVTDFLEHFDSDPEEISRCASLVRIHNVNAVTLRMFGVDRAEQFSNSLGEILGPALFPSFRDQLVALSKGDRFYQGETFARTMSGNTLEVAVSSVVPSGNEETLSTVLVSMIDITERNREKALDKALNEISGALASTLNFNQITDTVAAKATDALGFDACSIIIREDSGWFVRSVTGFPADLKNHKLTQAEVRMMHLVEGDPGIVVSEDTESDDPLDRELKSKYDVRSFIAALIVAKGKVLGLAFFCSRHRGHTSVPAEIGFVEKICASLGLALENATLYQAEHDVANTLQETLLTMPAKLEGIGFDYMYRSATEAARVGGDFYDLFEIEHKKIGIIVGDVSGKGIEAATLTALVKNMIRAYAYYHNNPAEVMSLTNDALIRVAVESTFVTVFFGTLDTESGSLWFCNAGHPPGMIKRQDMVAELSSCSPAIGVFAGLEYSDAREQLDPEDSLILYTDGVIEARRDSALFGDERLLDCIKKARGPSTNVPRMIFDRISEFAENNLTDDVAILSVVREPGGAELYAE